MNLQRLQFAWVRGARWQRHCHVWREGVWETVNGFPHHYYSDEDLRVHPNDAHMEYGPISTALWWWAMSPVFSTSTAQSNSTDWHAARHYWLAARFPTDIDGGAPGDYNMTEDECRMLALFVAEDVADQGL